ncbi:PREDICTED: protein DCL, chloroplastic-like [Nelumbo nucifera]|uniref:Protein DCL, chloroplastic-like n=1 Tax=Nelumbo nucifera TaxID=4432 RepID=A0A1U8A6I8_NELNU|nr:PREDICTED: protein DCL, chloroplastic-like [Nelumbo nucifera]
MTEVAHISQSIEGEDKATEDMELETEGAVQNPNISEEEHSNGGEKPEVNGDQSSTRTPNGDSKRPREEGDESDGEDGLSKKQKIEKSVEEERLEKLQQSEEDDEVKEDGKEKDEEQEKEEEKKEDPVSLGPKKFSSSEDMFNYFYKLLHYWPPNINVNEYEHMVLLDLLKKGHAEAEKKLGGGVGAFQVRYHPMWKSRCFFLIRHDESVDDFSFRKCVDHILPLPENMKVKSDVNKALGASKKGGGGRGGRGGGRGRGRGRRARN